MKLVNLGGNQVDCVLILVMSATWYSHCVTIQNCWRRFNHRYSYLEIYRNGMNIRGQKQEVQSTSYEDHFYVQFNSRILTYAGSSLLPSARLTDPGPSSIFMVLMISNLSCFYLFSIGVLKIYLLFIKSLLFIMETGFLLSIFQIFLQVLTPFGIVVTKGFSFFVFRWKTGKNYVKKIEEEKIVPSPSKTLAIKWVGISNIKNTDNLLKIWHFNHTLLLSIITINILWTTMSIFVEHLQTIRNLKGDYTSFIIIWINMFYFITI